VPARHPVAALGADRCSACALVDWAQPGSALAVLRGTVQCRSRAMALSSTTRGGDAPLFPHLGAALARNWWAVLVRGILAIGFSLIAFFSPGTTMLSLVFVFAAYALFDGIMALAAIWPAARSGGRWGLLALEGIADIGIAVLAAMWPGLTVTVFVLMV